MGRMGLQLDLGFTFKVRIRVTLKFRFLVRCG